MGRGKRPWKMRYHFDGTKTFGPTDDADDRSTQDMYTIDTSRPIDGMSSHSYQGEADSAARRVSRNGGTAHITYKDPDTGIETPVITYAPYEVAMEDLVADIHPDR